MSNIVQFPLASPGAYRPTAHVGANLLREPPAHVHAVQFYDDDCFLCETVAFFLQSGLDAGDSAMVIATAPHIQGILAHSSPSARERAIESGQLVVIDAEALLGRFTIGGEPEETLFVEAVERMMHGVSATLQPGRRIHLFGEMVDLLWRQGKPATAIRLEDFWSRFTATHEQFAVLCAYGMRNFYKSDESQQFAEVCRLHTHVLPTERFARDRGDDFDRLREISVLEQRARLLQNEVQYREELESALREALAERERVQSALDASIERERGGRLLPRLALTSMRLQRGIEQVLTVARERLSDGLPGLALFDRDVSALVTRVVDELRRAHPTARFELLARPSCYAPIAGDQLRQALIHLIRRAIDFGDALMPIDVEVAELGPEVRVRIHHHGRPIAPELLRALFETGDRRARTFSRRSDDAGRELHLSKRIVTDHGGQLEISSTFETGTAFLIRLPRAPRAAPG